MFSEDITSHCTALNYLTEMTFRLRYLHDVAIGNVKVLTYINLLFQDCVQFHQCKLDYKYMCLCILRVMDECFCL